PVGPPPTITTACSVMATLRSSPRQGPTRPHAARTSTTTHAFRDSVGSSFSRRFYRMTRVLKQAPCAPHIRAGRLQLAADGRFGSLQPSAPVELHGAARPTPDMRRHRWRVVRTPQAVFIGCPRLNGARP